MKKLSIHALLLTALFMQSFAYAGFDEGKSAYKKGDYQTAFKEFKLSAEQDNAIAQLTLGAMYAEGKGVAQDHQQAVYWYRKAAEQGNTNAQSNLGLAYTEGKGVAQDYQKAAVWYLMSAEQGNASAQFNIGVMYEQGQGVIQDHVQAHKWYNIASANNGNEKARNFRDDVAKTMTPYQIEKAQKLAREWMKQQ